MCFGCKNILFHLIHHTTLQTTNVKSLRISFSFFFRFTSASLVILCSVTDSVLQQTKYSNSFRAAAVFAVGSIKEIHWLSRWTRQIIYQQMGLLLRLHCYLKPATKRKVCGLQTWVHWELNLQRSHAFRFSLNIDKHINVYQEVKNASEAKRASTVTFILENVSAFSINAEETL